ncbi:hypothetical protein TrRE_jg3304, partial [Triparma retinervis]
MFLFRC